MGTALIGYGGCQGGCRAVSNNGGEQEASVIGGVERSFRGVGVSTMSG